jgi:hypothetical protein
MFMDRLKLLMRVPPREPPHPRAVAVARSTATDKTHIHQLNLQCLICLSSVDEPVFVSATGKLEETKFVYHSECIGEWLRINPTDPRTRSPVDTLQVRPILRQHVAHLLVEPAKVWNTSGDVVHYGPLEDLCSLAAQSPGSSLWTPPTDCTSAQWQSILDDIQCNWPRVQPVCDGLNRMVQAGCVPVDLGRLDALKTPARLLLVERLTITEEDGLDCVLRVHKHCICELLPASPAYLTSVDCEEPFALRLLSDDGHAQMAVRTPGFTLKRFSRQVRETKRVFGADFAAGTEDGAHFVDVFPSRKHNFCAYAKTRQIVVQTDAAFVVVHQYGEHLQNRSPAARRRAVRRLQRARAQAEKDD